MRRVVRHFVATDENGLKKDLQAYRQDEACTIQSCHSDPDGFLPAHSRWLGIVPTGCLYDRFVRLEVHTMVGSVMVGTVILWSLAGIALQPCLCVAAAEWIHQRRIRQDIAT